jgi:hypothetical protein
MERQDGSTGGRELVEEGQEAIVRGFAEIGFGGGVFGNFLNPLSEISPAAQNFRKAKCPGFWPGHFCHYGFYFAALSCAAQRLR